MALRLLAVLILAAALPAQAQVYKWVDAKGQVNYSNAPPPSVAGVAQPVEEKLSVIGMDPAVRAYAERSFANRAAADERDWQMRQRAMSVQQASAPIGGYGDSYASSYYSPYYYGGYYGGYVRPAFRPRVMHHAGGQRVTHHALMARSVSVSRR